MQSVHYRPNWLSRMVKSTQLSGAKPEPPSGAVLLDHAGGSAHISAHISPSFFTPTIYGQYRSIFNHCNVFRQQRNRNRRKKRKIRAILRRSGSSKVIEVGTNRKPVCDFLLVINSLTSYLVPFRRYRCLLVKFWTLRFRATLWGLRDNVICSCWAYWKARSGLPISDNWTFFARCYGYGSGATSENRSKIGDFTPTRSVLPKISGRKGRSSPIIFACQWMPYNCVADSFHTEKLCSRLSSREVRF